MRCRRSIVAITTAWLTTCGIAAVARGDGGAVRFSQRIGNRVVTVFTSPTPVRAGPVDISVLMQDVESGAALLDEPIAVQIHPLDRPSETTIAPATNEAATNKLLRAARFELAEPGDWHVNVLTPGAAAGSPIGFDMNVAAPAPHLPDLALWIGWPLAAIGLFAIHQHLVHRREPRIPARSGASQAATPVVE